MNTFDITSLTGLLTAACAVLGCIQLLFLFGVYNQVRKTAASVSNEQADPAALPPLSVILVTKDSAAALRENLPLLLQQDYPWFEVIVVNDQSAGTDEDVLKQLSACYPNLYYTFIPPTARYVSRKKLGVAMGIYVLVALCGGRAVAGWASIMMSIWLLGGLQLMALGLIGEYIGKIYMETKRRPKFILEEYLHKD